MLVEFGVSKLSVAFVDVPSLVPNNSTRTFVRGFYNYDLVVVDVWPVVL